MRADLVLYNGNIRTLDPTAPQAEALAIAGARILAVGTNAEMRALAGPGSRAVDLRGRAVLPGFHDCHVHFMAYGTSLDEVSLLDVPSLEQALAKVGARANATPDGEWITGRGWDHTAWDDTFPTCRDLDGAAARHPVLLRSKCGHAAWANSLALEKAGVTAQTQDTPGGTILRDAAGRPTGILKEKAIHLVARLLKERSPDEARAAIETAMSEAVRHGLTTIHNLEGNAAFRAFQCLRDAGKLTVRAVCFLPEGVLDALASAGLQTGFGDEWVRLGGIKSFADGALGARSAHLLTPYEGDPANHGVAVNTPDHLRAAAVKAGTAGLAVAVHAIGDFANRVTLDAFEAARRAGGGPNLRHRVEHAQLVHPDDAPRFRALGVVASMQPIHATQDMVMAETHWGARCAHAYAWRHMLNAGAALAFGSDAPVEGLSVLAGIHAAVTRRRPNGHPGPDGWRPEQRLTVREAVHAYTAGAAYAGGEERIKGTLTPGKLADLVVLSMDIFAIEPAAVLETEVVATMLGGRFVYDKQGNHE